MTEAEPEITAAKAWLLAARPRTLALALAGVGLGIFLAVADGFLNWPVAALSLVTAILLQTLSNLANDYGDSLHGADSAERAGPRRAVQSGFITPRAMRRAILFVVALAMVTGLSTVILAFGVRALVVVVLFLLLGAAALWAAIAYTASSRPYGYAGFGDLFVFIFFGWVAVLGGYYLQTQALAPKVFLPATSAGLFSVAVLNVNNIRDIDSDRAAGKHSIPVRIGRDRARFYHWALLSLGLLSALLFVLLDYRSLWQVLFLITAPLLVQNGLAVSRGRSAEELDPLLKQMSLTTLLFVITFGLGQTLA